MTEDKHTNIKEMTCRFFSDIIWRSFSKYFVAALGTLSSIATLISFLLMWNNGLSQGARLNVTVIIVMGLLMLLICAAYAFLMIKRKSRIELWLNSNFKLIIEKGDLFSKEGTIVIPVNEYFDTIVNEEIISADTVHGKWINEYWKDRIPELDSKIDRKLKSAVDSEEIKRVNTNEHRQKGKKDQYQVGSCISIRDGKNTYVLCALTYFDEGNRAYLPRTEFSKVIEHLFEFLHTECTEQPIYLPLFGTGLSRLNRSYQRILSYVVDIIDFKHSKMSFPKGIHIEIRPDSFWKVNLNQVEHHFKNTFRDETE